MNPAFAADPVAIERVSQSKILLDLDHPEFNSKREQLYVAITELKSVRIFRPVIRREHS